MTNTGISSIFASKPLSSYNKSIGFFSDKEASDYEQNLARLILANTAMRNSTNPDAIEAVEMAKKEIAKKVRFRKLDYVFRQTKNDVSYYFRSPDN